MSEPSEANIISQCGCEVRDANGNLAVNVMRGIAHETNLIRKLGYRAIKAIDYYLTNRVRKRPADPGEAENPREYTEYSFALDHTNVRAQNLLNDGGDEALQVQLQQCNSVAEAVEVLQKAQGSPGCDLRSSELIGGHEVHRGIYRVIPMKTPCVCILDFARSHDFAGYLRAIRNTIPREIQAVKERDFLRRVGEAAHYVTAEPGNAEIQFNIGQFPHLPQGAPQIATFQHLAMLLKANGYSGMVEVPMHYTCLQSMMVAYHASHGSIVQVAKWTNWADLPIQTDEMGQYYDFVGIRFRLCNLPHRGYFDEIGADTHEFVPLDPREPTLPDEGKGLIFRIRRDFFNSFIDCGGQRRQNVEIAPVIDPRAFVQKPFAMADPGVEGIDAQIWNATSVRVISGAFIDCNTRRQKFYFEADSSYKVYPEMPYLAGMVAYRVPNFIQQLNELGLTERCVLDETNINIHAGQNPPANSCGDDAAGLNPYNPAPLPQDGCSRPNDEGEFRILCAVETVPGQSSVTILVERINGTSGAASLDYTTADVTATAGSDYTLTAGTLNWVDGEGGVKAVEVPILAGADDGEQFNVNFSAPTGASFMSGGCQASVVTINNDDCDGYGY